MRQIGITILTLISAWSALAETSHCARDYADLLSWTGSPQVCAYIYEGQDCGGVQGILKANRVTHEADYFYEIDVRSILVKEGCTIDVLRSILLFPGAERLKLEGRPEVHNMDWTLIKSIHSLSCYCGQISSH
ncbi:hypothetical protein QR680_018318 [Steinernema hermaphroditum]|uniref:Uncharacterized protein n=1 Tax=Steinernema hermaphroditum TaxID=289476 RepID=A0AA39HIV0_9BILA|nr:hypothetical protein QR680_018318 [Steinernema hermaphroditum]